MNINDYKTGFHIGMHGLGFADGVAKKNTADVFEYWYRHGIRFFETDVAFTSDREIVLLAHDFIDRYLHRLEIYEKPEDGKWSRDYVSSLIVGRKTSQSGFLFWDDLCRIIKKAQDAVFMIDPYGRNEDEINDIVGRIKDLVESFPSAENRILLEIYTRSDVSKIKKQFPKICLIGGIEEKGYDFFEENLTDKEKADIVVSLQLDFVSCPYEYCSKNCHIIKACNQGGMGVLSFSRFDTGRRKKKSLGINVNLVDIYTGEGYHRHYSRIIKSMAEYLVHRFRMIRLTRVYRERERR